MNSSDPSWQAVIDLLDTAVLVTDDAHVLLYANPAAMALLPGVAPKVHGRRLDKVLPPLQPFLGSDGPPAGALGERSETLQLALPDGTSGLFHVSIARRTPGPHSSAGFVVSLQRVPEEIRRNLFPQMSSSVSALMPTFLHELKNPLAAIATSVELLLEDLPDDPVRHELMAIFGEIRRMKLVLDGMGIMGRQLRTQNYWPVQESLQEACLVLLPLAKRKGLHFETNIPKYAPLPFDASVLKAVLFNLVMNAIHACSKGQTVKVSSLVVNNALRITVEDNGHGMSKETLEQCTRLFFTTKPFGSGIGLALCQEVAREARGTLRVRSREGRGTRATFEVPLQLEQVEERSRISAIGGEE